MKKLLLIIFYLIFLNLNVRTQANPIIDPFEGREVQNGDFTFAERGRHLLKESIEHLNIELRDIKFHDLNMISPDIQQSAFQDIWRTALATVKIPSNQELLNLNITNNYFSIHNLTMTPQLDFFVDFGKEIGPITRILYLIECQRLILQNIGTMIGLDNENRIKFAEKVISRIYTPQNTTPEAPTFVQVASHINSNSAFKFLKMIANFQAKHQHSQRIMKTSDYRYIIHPSTFLSGDSQNSAKIQALCIRETAPHSQCSNGINYLSYRFYTLVSFYTYDDQESSYFPNLQEASLFIIETGNNSGFFRIKLNIEGTSQMENFPLSFNFDLASIKQKNDYFDSYKQATKLLKEAQSQLQNDIEYLDDNDFAKLKQKSNFPNIEKQQFIDKIRSLKSLTWEEFNQNNISIKNFNFNDQQKFVFATKTYYINFSYFSSVTDRTLKLLQAKKLVFHEICHLFGKNDTESLTTWKILQKLLKNKINTDQIETFLHINPKQKSITDYVLQSDKFREKLFKQQQEASYNYFKAHNLQLKNISQTTLETNHFCYLEEVKTSCRQQHNALHKIHTIQTTFTLSDERIYQLQYQLLEHIFIENATENFAKINVKFSYIKDGFSDVFHSLQILGGNNQNFLNPLVFKYFDDGKENFIPLIEIPQYNILLDSF